MEHGFAADVASAPGLTSSISPGRQDFPQYPGEDTLAHTASLYEEAATTRLSSLGLLAAAQGHTSPAVKCIVDVDLSELPELPATHRDHTLRLETRIRIKAQNRANDEKRKAITMRE